MRGEGGGCHGEIPAFAGMTMGDHAPTPPLSVGTSSVENP
jgi:hypothetical protein